MADEVSSGPIEDKALSLDDINNLLAEDKGEETDIPAKKTKTQYDKKDDSSEEEEEDQITLEDDKDDDKELEDDDEKLELTTPIRRQEILKKYPNLFKDFPYLEKAYYREQQFTELLPTIKDAKEVVERAKTFDQFEESLMGGSPESVLSAVKAADEDAFKKIVDNYLPSLAKIDQNAYYHVVGGIIKQTIVSMANEANRIGSEGLKQAARNLNQFVFSTAEYVPPVPYGKQNSPTGDEESTKLQKEREAFIQQQFETHRDELATKAQNVLKSTIDSNIDPAGTMSDYVKRNAVREVLEAVEVAIGEDSRFRTLNDKLWEKAFESKFSQRTKDDIRSAYLSKAKTVLPAIIRRIRNEALRGQSNSKKADETSELEEKAPAGKRITRESTSPSTSGKKGSSKEIPKGMRTIDFLMSD